MNTSLRNTGLLKSMVNWAFAMVTLVCLLSTTASAQYAISYQESGGDALPTENVNICYMGADSTNTVRIRVRTSDGQEDDARVTITMPPGVTYVPGTVMEIANVGGLDIVEDDISDLTAPVFEITPSNLTENQEITISYAREGDCAAKDHAVAGGKFKDEIKVCGNSGTGNCVEDTDVNLNSYDVLLPSIGLLGQGDTIAVLGDTVDRNVTLTNGGQGILKDFKFYILDGTGTSTLSLKTPGGTVIPPTMSGDSLIYMITSAIIMEFGDMDDDYENGEQVILNRIYSIDSCDNDSYYGAYWGCNGAICQSTDLLQQKSILPNITPDIAVTLVTPTMDSFCFSGQNAKVGGTPIVNTFEVKNNGTGIAKNFRLFMSNATPGSTVSEVYFSDDNWIVKDASGAILGVMGNPDVVSSSTFYQADCSQSSQATNLWKDVGDIEIPAGESVFIEIPTYAENVSCWSDCYQSNNGWWVYNAAWSYTDLCEANNYGVTRRQLGGNQHNFHPTTIEMPTDLRDGECYDFEVYYTNLYTNVRRTDKGYNYLWIDLTNTGSAYAGGPTIDLIPANSSNPTYAVPVDVFGDSIRVTLPNHLAGFGSELFVPLCASCDDGGGTKTITTWHTVSYNETCDGPFKKYCNSRTFVMHCPGCDLGGATPTNFSLERVSYGLADADNNGHPDGTALADPADVKLHRAINCDTVRGAWEIVVYDNNNADAADPNIGVPFNHVYVEFNLAPYNGCTIDPFTTLFEALPDAVVQVFPGGSGPAINCTVSPTIDGFTARYDLSGCKGAGGTWGNNDSIYMEALFNVNSRVGSGGIIQHVTDNEVYSSYIPNPTGSNPSSAAPYEKYTCDHYNDYMNVHNFYYSFHTSSPQNVNGCTGSVVFDMRQYINTQSGDIYFPNEYRPLAIISEVTFNIPDAFQIRSGSVKFGGVTIPDVDVNQGGDQVTFQNLAQHYISNGGTIRDNDENWNIVVRFDVDPTCSATPGVYDIGVQEFYVQGIGCHAPSTPFLASNCAGVALGNQRSPLMTYNAPQPFLSGGGTRQMIEKQLCWDVILNNASNDIDAEFSWFYLDDQNGTLSNFVVKDENGVEIPVDGNGFFQLGDNVANASTPYEICADADGCDTAKLNVIAGYQCGAYPLSIVGQDCADTVQLIGLPLASEVQLVVLTEPSTPLPLCVEQPVEVKISSAQAANLDNAALFINLPSGTAVYTPIMVEYPAGSGNIEPGDITIFSPTLLQVNLEGHSGIDDFGIPGTINDGGDPLNREALITFQIQTDCDFTLGSAIEFRAFGYRPCGNPADNFGITSATSDLQVDGASAPYTTAINVDAEPEMDGCEESLVVVDMNFLGDAVGTTSDKDSVVITIEPGMEFVPGSFNCCSSNPATCLTFVDATVDGAGQTTIRLSIPANIDIVPSVQSCFSYKVVPAADGPCNLSMATTIEAIGNISGVVCPTVLPDMVCPNVKIITGKKTIEQNVDKPALSILTNSFVVGSIPAGGFNYEVDVKLDSALDIGDVIDVEFFCLTSLGTHTNTPIGTTQIFGPQAKGITLTLMGMLPAGCDIDDGIRMVIPQKGVSGAENCICGADSIDANLIECSGISSITSVDPDCEEDNGSITVVIDPTTPNVVQYSLDKMTWQLSPTFNNLEAGGYTVYTRNPTTDLCNDSAQICLVGIGCCDLISGEDLVLTPQDPPPAADEEDLYLLVDENGIIVATSTIPLFTTTGLSGIYNVHVVRYPTANPPTGTGVGSPVAAIDGCCFEISACTPVTICDITHVKMLATAGVQVVDEDTYTVTYEITVTNNGASAANYSLLDSVAFENDATITAASFTFEGGPSMALSPIPPTGSWTLATDSIIAAGDEHTYLLTVTLDALFRPGDPVGDNTYDACGSGSVTGEPAALEGLFNRSLLDIGNTGTIDEIDTACADLPGVLRHEKSIATAPAINGSGNWEICYLIQVFNEGGGPAMYDLRDSIAFDDDIVAIGANVSFNGSFPTNLGTPMPINGWLLADNNNLLAGDIDSFMLCVEFEFDVTSGDGIGDDVLTPCGDGSGGMEPAAGEALFNVSLLDVDNDGNEDERDTACADLPLITHTKTLASVDSLTNTGGYCYDVTYTIEVRNDGTVDGEYNLLDSIAFDDDMVVSGATATGPSGAITLPATMPAAGWVLASDVAIPAGTVHNYSITVSFCYDFSDGDMTGDNVYNECGAGTSGGAPAAGEALFNVSLLDLNDDGTADEKDTACADVPVITHVKDLAGMDSLIQLGPNSYRVTYEIVVTNEGGVTGTYQLADSVAFDDDMVLTAVMATGPSGNIPLSINPPGGYYLLAAPGVDLAAGATHTYTISFDFTYDFDAGDATGDNTYDQCGGAGGTGMPMAGQALFNLSLLDANNDNTPDERDTACADIPLISHIKELAAMDSLVRTGPNSYDVTYTITVNNDGPVSGMYDLLDSIAFDDDFVVTAVMATGPSGAIGGLTPAMPAGGWVLADDVMIPGNSSHEYTITFSFTYDFDAADATGDNTYTACGDGSGGTDLAAGEALFNLSLLDVNNDGMEDERDTACADIPLISLEKTVVVDPAPTGNPDEFQLTYQIVVSNDGAVQATYDLLDTFQYGAAVGSITNVTATYVGSSTDGMQGTSGMATFNGDDMNILTTGETIDPGLFDVYRIEVRFVIDPVENTMANSDCDLTTGDPDNTGLLNRAILTEGGQTVTDTACRELPMPDITHVKMLAAMDSLIFNSPQNYTVVYEIEVTNNGPVSGFYDLLDSIAFDDDINVLSAEFTFNAGAPTALPLAIPAAGWVLADDVLLGAGATDVYTLSVTFDYDLAAGDMTGNNIITPCGSRNGGGSPVAGEALFNLSLLDIDNDGMEDERDTACVDLPVCPDIAIQASEVVDANCGTSNGSAAVVPTGSTTGMYNFVWSGPNAFASTDSAITMLEPGNYTVTVTSTDPECPVGVEHTVTVGTVEGPEIQIADKEDATCNAADGSAEVEVLSGDAPFTYLWSNVPASTTNQATGLVAGTYYVTVWDANNCPEIESVEIESDPGNFQVFAGATPANCGQADGSASAGSSNGTAPFTYLWSNGATTQDITGLLSGNYCVTVTDAIGCVNSDCVTVNDDGGPSLTTTVSQNVLCKGDATGVITSSTDAGASIFVYNSGGALVGTGTVVSGLPAGMYTVTAVDANGCRTSKEAEVTEPEDELEIELTSIDDADCISMLGNVGIDVTGGTAPYTYSWTGPGGFTSTNQDLVSIPAGTYDVTVTDANMCTVMSSYTVNQEDDCCPDIAIQASVVVDAHCGETDGTATVIPTGSMSGYDFVWSGPNVTAPTDSLQTNLGPGVYNVTVTATGADASCPPAIAQVTVGNLEGPAIEVVSTGDATCDDADGSAMVNVLSGTPPYTYAWDNGAGTAASATGLTAGMYCVTVTDGDGCVELGCVEIESTPGDLTLTMSSTPANCDMADGTIGAVIGGGTANFTYTWNPNVGTTASISGVGAGTYCVTVVDANGCTVEDCVVVSEVGGPSLTTDATSDVGCKGDATGIITSSTDAGATISVYDDMNNLVGSGPVVTGLPAGEYTVIATDGSGCETRDLVEIEEPKDILSLEISRLNPADCISGLGNIDIDVMGGTPPYTYDWNNGAYTTQDLTAVPVGNYCVVVTDANGCTIDECIMLILEEDCCPDIAIQASVVVDAHCGDTDGTATVIPTGSMSGYDFVWSGPNVTVPTDSLQTNLGPGVYNVTVTATGADASCPPAIAQVTVGNLEGPAIEVVSTGDATCDDADGSAMVNVLSGTPPYTYAWDNGAGTAASATGLTAGMYCVTVTDGDGCVELGCVEIESTPGDLTLTMSSTPANCDMADGTIGAVIGGGTANFTYTWNPNVGTTASISGVGAGTYCVTVVDANGCTVEDCVVVSEVGGPSLTTDATSDVGCKGDATGIITSSTDAGATISVYDDMNNLVGSGPVVTGLPAGEYTVIATDGSGCETRDLVEIEEPKDILSLEISRLNPADCISGLGNIDIDVMGGTPPYTYDWNNGAYTTQDLTAVPVGNYCVVVTDANGCTIDECIMLILEEDCCPDIAIQASVVVDAHCGDTDGTATVIPTGSMSGYDFVWSGPNVTVPTDSLQTNLGPGVYNVTVTATGADASCPPAIAQVTVGNLEGPAIEVVSTGDATCDDADGSAMVNVLSGTPPYTYAWDNGAGTAASATGLTAGMYCVTVTDGDGCVEIGCVEIESTPGSLVVTMGSTPSVCGAATGTVTANTSGGTTPYTYMWSPMSGTTATISNLGAGTYCVTVTDLAGCTIEDCITIGEIGGPTLAITSITDVLCIGDASGTVTLATSPGATVALYDADNNLVGSGLIISGLPAGEYTAVATDASGCETRELLEIEEPKDILSLEISRLIPADCISGLGNIDIDVMGGTPPYTYDWNGGAYTTQDLLAVPVGNYCVTVTDANGCVIDECIMLISEDECCPDIYVQVSVVVDENCGESNGTAAVVPVGSPAGYNFMWDNGSTDSLQTGLAPGVYCVTITADVAGCPAGTEYCITVGSLEGPAIEVVSTSDATCNDADGSAMVNVLSGTPPYTYVWDNSVTTASNPGLTAGMYCVTVTDADGCSEVGCVEIDMTPGSLTLNMSGTDTDCGAATGSVEAVIGGGLAPFTYTWSPALGNAAMHNNVGAGTYCVTVTDANGCVVEDCVAVGETGGPSLTADASTDVLCIGDASGVITSSSTGDISVYDMEGNLVGSGPVVSGLIAGEYTVVATDASGCETRELVEIEEPSEVLDLEMSEITPADCISGLGNVGIDVMGGTAPYTYAWDNGSTTEDLTAVPVGTYCVVVTDANGCTVEGCVELISEDECCPDIYVQVSVVVDENCGESNGTAAVVPVGSPAGYNFMWDNGSTDSLQTGLAPGVYCVTITADVAGCPAGTEYCITVGSLEGPAIEVVSTSDATCNDADGSAMVNVLSGTPPYTYVWDNSVTTASNPGLTAGMYCVTVTDADGCSEVGCVEIDMTPGSLTLNMSGTDTDCGAATGSVEAVIGGGLAPFTYTWSPALGNAAMHNNVGAGTYCVTVTDANGCVVEDCVAVGETGGPSLTADASTDVLCIGDASGVITSSSTGDISVYDMEGNLVGSGPVVSGLIAGEYTVVATDASGCETRELVEIEEPSEVLDLEMSEITPADCISGLGNVGIDVMGGTAPYTYAWDNGSTTEDLTAVPVGTYCVVVTDANGCTVEGCVELISEDECCPDIYVQVSVVVDENCGESNGTAAVVPVGSPAGYNFMWDNGSTDSLQTGLAPGVYCVTITADVAGCPAGTEYCITVGSLEGPAIEVVSTSDATCNDADGSAMVNVLSGTPPYTYVWDNSVTTASNPGLTAGMYCVTVTDADGCSEVGCVEIDMTPGSLTLNMSGTDTDCGAATGSVEAVIGGGLAPFTYTWSPALGNAAMHNNVGAGTYCVTVTDANGCVVEDCVAVGETGGPSLTADASTDVLCIGDASGVITSSSTGDISVYDMEGNLVGSGPVVSGLIAGEYTVVATDASGCETRELVEIEEPSEVLDLEMSEITPADCISGLGNVGIDVMGGTAPYTYAWDNGSTTEDLTAVPVGTYCVVVTDANGCTVEGCVELISEDECCPDIYVQVSVVVDENCGESNGTAAVVPVGSPAGYNFMWDNGSTDSLQTGLAPGVYCVTITADVAGCPAGTEYCITVGSLEGPAIEVVSTSDATCNDADGSAMVNVLSGTPPYTYVWDNSVTTASNPGLTAGMYCVTVTDADGCSEVGCVEIDMTPGSLTLNMSGTDTDCGAATGSVEAVIGGGLAPFTYTWSPALGNAAMHNNVGAGTYCVTVTDANGCVVEDCVAVGETGGPSLTADASTDVLCIGDASGVITSSSTGDISVYDMEGNLVGSGPVVSGLIAGEYTVVATDASGCETRELVEIEEPSEVLDLEMSEITPADCISGLGNVGIDVMGGTAPYTYAWDNGSTTEDLTAVPVGTYCVVVTDANGCTVEGCVELISEDECCPDIYVQVSVVVDENCGESNGTAAVVPVGSPAGYNFMWDNGSTDSLQTGLAPGVYCVTITADVAGCPAGTEYCITVGSLEGPAIEVVSTSDATCNDADGSAMVNVLSGTPPYTYVWDNSVTTASNPGLTAGMYCVTVTDADGCSEVGCVEIDMTPGSLTLNMSGTDTDCGAATGSVEAVIGGGLAPFTYTWSPALGNAAMHNNVGAGTYCVTVTDANGCVVEDCVAVGETGGPSLTADASTDVLCIGDASGVITSSSTGDISVYDMEGNLVGSGPVVSGLIAGEYTVVATDASGCETRELVEIEEPSEVLDLEMSEITPADCISGLGNVGIDVMGGTAPYTYAWDNGSTTEDLTAVPVGTYCVVVTDANGCTVEGCVELISEDECCPDIYVQVSVVVDENCGESNGTAAVVPVGSPAGYNFMWDNGSTDSLQTGLAPGVYCVTITADVAGCPAGTEYCITVGSLEGPAIEVVSTSDATCNDADGSAMVNVLSGTPPYTYVWDNSVTTASNPGLTAGMYCVTVTDADGCSEVGCVEIDMTPGSLTLNMSGTDTDCGAATGSVEAVIGGGLAPFTYTWSPALGNAAMHNNVGAGTYCVTVTDANGCVVEDCVAVGETGGPSLTADASTDVLCIGDASGVITSSSTGDISVYDMEGNLVGSGPVVSGLIAGEYTVVATDASGCETRELVEIEEPSEVLDLEMSEITPADCISGLGNVGIDCNGRNSAIHICMG